MDQEDSGRIVPVDEQMRALWPDMGEKDAGDWMALPLERKSKAIRRLRALLMVQREGSSADIVADAVGLAGMGTSTFYAMRKRWSEKRTLASLGLYARKRASDGEATPATAGVRAMVAETLASRPEAGPAFVAQKLAGMGVSVPSTTLQRMVRDARLELPIAAPFGRRLIFDNAGADLVDRQGRPQRLCVVLDDDTGLILGWFVSDDDIYRGYLGAASHAVQVATDFIPGAKDLGSLGDLDLAGVPMVDVPPATDFLVSPDQWSSRRSGWKRLADGGSSILERPRVGNRIVRELGERVGPVWIGSNFRHDGRSFRTGRPAHPLLASVELGMTLGRAVHERNLRRLSRIVRHPTDDVGAYGGTGGSEGIGLVEDALRAVVPRGFYVQGSGG